jgi:hypothetical protein
MWNRNDFFILETNDLTVLPYLSPPSPYHVPQSIARTLIVTIIVEPTLISPETVVTQWTRQPHRGSMG